MREVLDDIRFLADSEHRPVVMDLLVEEPRSRATLREETGASSATVGRILGAFEERGWLVREGSRYALTALGGFVAESFDRLQHDMALAHELNELLPYVPLSEIGIGVESLTDATVTHATQFEPFAVVSRVRELERISAEARSLTDFFPEPCIEGRYESIVNGTQTFEAVFAPVVVELAMESAFAAEFEAIVAADRADVYLFDGEIEYPVMFHDGVGCLVVRNEVDVSIGMIESDDETFVEWVTDTFERYRADATLLAPADLAEPLEDVLARA
jgi:predicted transcriptional regulator